MSFKNNLMTVDQVISFLKMKPGYKKEGANRLANSVLNGAACVETCKQALKKIRSMNTNAPSNKKLKVLIYDIETSFNIVSTWRTGYNINLPHNSIIKERQIICVSYKWLGEDDVHTIDWGYRAKDDKRVLENFIPVLNEADVIVAHNGDKFDIKWIRTRALKHELEMLPIYNQVDTLKIAKKKFYFNSNKLDYISKFLGFEGKIVNEPGLWDNVILGEGAEALEALIKMIKYCEEDVRQLEKVYIRLKDWDKPKQHAGALLFGNAASSPVSGSDNLELVKTLTTPAGTLKRIMKDKDTGCTFEMSDANYRKFLKNKE